MYDNSFAWFCRSLDIPDIGNQFNFMIRAIAGRLTGLRHHHRLRSTWLLEMLVKVEHARDKVESAYPGRSGF